MARCKKCSMPTPAFVDICNACKLKKVLASKTHCPKCGCSTRQVKCPKCGHQF